MDANTKLQETEKLLKQFQKAQYERNSNAVHKSYRLLKQDTQASELIREKIINSNYQAPATPQEGRAIAELCHLLFSIDENAGRAVAEIILKDCHSVIGAALQVCLDFLNSYTIYKSSHSRILVHKTLASNQEIAGLIKDWLQILPSEDLSNVVAFYISPAAILPKSILGLYLSLDHTVTLVWKSGQTRDKSYATLYLLAARAILYHEVGHHFCKHIGGADPRPRQQRENEADSYAWSYICKAYPALSWTGRIGRFLIFQVLVRRRYSFMLQEHEN